MTTWDNKESADHYEQSEVFQDILKKATDVAPAPRWKTELESPPSERVYSSRDMSVDSCAVVAGKSFGGGSAARAD